MLWGDCEQGERRGAQGRSVNSKGIWGSGGFVGTQDYLSSNIKSSKTLNKILKNETLSYIAWRGKTD